MESSFQNISKYGTWWYSLPIFHNNYFPIIYIRNFLAVVLLTEFIESLYFKNLILPPNFNILNSMYHILDGNTDSKFYCIGTKISPSKTNVQEFKESLSCRGCIHGHNKNTTTIVTVRANIWDNQCSIFIEL